MAAVSYLFACRGAQYLVQGRFGLGNQVSFAEVGRTLEPGVAGMSASGKHFDVADEVHLKLLLEQSMGATITLKPLP